MRGEVRTNTSPCFLWKGGWATATDSCVRLSPYKTSRYSSGFTLLEEYGRCWLTDIWDFSHSFIKMYYIPQSFLPAWNDLYEVQPKEHISRHCPKGQISSLLLFSAHWQFTIYVWVCVCIFIYYLYLSKFTAKIHRKRVPFNMQSRKTVFHRVATHCAFCSVILTQCLGFTDAKEVNKMLY